MSRPDRHANSGSRSLEEKGRPPDRICSGSQIKKTQHRQQIDVRCDGRFIKRTPFVPDHHQGCSVEFIENGGWSVLIAISKVWRYVNTAPMSPSTVCKKCMWNKTDKGNWIRRQSFLGALAATSLFQEIASALGSGWVSSHSARAASSGSIPVLPHHELSSPQRWISR
jgi:hypothetical protein